MIREVRIRLQEKQQLAPDTMLLRFAAAELAGLFQPGQFLELSGSGLLKRPFGLMEQDPAAGTVAVGIKMIGPRSRELGALSLGAEIDAIGPLGHGFALEGCQELLAIGGGSGIFPLYAALARARELAIPAHLIAGFADPAAAYPRELAERLGADTLYSADHGVLDLQGNAADALEAFLAQHSLPPQTLLISCGPAPMMRRVRDIAAERGYACQLSLEERMACGLGLCLTCAVDIRTRDGQLRRVRCCHEGPVFAGSEVVFAN